MNETLLLGLVVVVAPILSAITLSVLTARQRVNDKKEDAKIRREEKQEDWARQDKVAAEVSSAAALAVQVAEQAKTAATLLLGAQTRSGERLDEVARLAAQAAKSTDGQLKQIHILVNNQLTTAIRSAYDSKVATLASMNELVDLKKAMGKEPNVKSTALIAITEAEIAELATQLADRQKAADAVEEDQKTNPMEQT